MEQKIEKALIEKYSCNTKLLVSVALFCFILIDIMNLRTIFALFVLSCTTATAQNNKPLNLTVEARGDYQYTSVDGEKDKDQSGFKGNIVDFVLKGDLSPKFSYAYRQRLNGINKDYTFFDATDWLYLKYKPTNNLSLIAGKYIVLVAGWELYPAPIDCYFLSEFCYNFLVISGDWQENMSLIARKMLLLLRFARALIRNRTRTGQVTAQTCMPTTCNGWVFTAFMSQTGQSIS